MICDYNELLDIIKNKQYKIIIVSGPQRSGTTYIGNTLANQLNYKYIDETKYKTHNEKLFNELLTNNNENIVVQAPAMSHILHNIDIDNTLIIFMYRNDEDIIESENRIKWHPKETITEFNKYHIIFNNMVDIIKTFKRSSPMKKWFWENIQKDKSNIDTLDVSYEIVKQTNNYIEPEKRKKFSSKQIK